MRPVRALPLLVALAAATPARAEPVLALRLGVAPALGSATGNLPMSELLPLQFPVQLDALWREGRLDAGLYGSWGLAEASGCASGERCSATVWRTGVQAAWTFDADGVLPWAGLALGWEWARTVTQDAGTITSTFSGAELALQGGVEWRVLRWLSLGPALLVGIGNYGTYGVEGPAGSASSTVTDRAFHAWIHVGVRGTFSPWSAP